MSVNIMFRRSYAKKLLPISREIRSCDSKAHQFVRKDYSRHKLNILVMLLIDGALNISYIVIFVWGIYGIQNNTFSYAELIVFLQLAGQIQIPFIQFNHNFAPGSVTAILGETGAGKSTLLRMFLAVLRPNSGSITFYGNENGKLKKYEASSQTCVNCVYVPQGNSLISGTIRYNLLLGKTDATEDEMRKAL